MFLATIYRSLEFQVVVNTMRQLFAKSHGEAVSVNLADALSGRVGKNQNGKGQGKGKVGGTPPTCHGCGREVIS